MDKNSLLFVSISPWTFLSQNVLGNALEANEFTTQHIERIIQQRRKDSYGICPHLPIKVYCLIDSNVDMVNT